MSDLHTLSIKDLLTSLESGDVSSREIVDDCLSAANKAEDLNCFISLNAEQALSDAEDADKQRARGETKPLLGVPIAVKDLILTKGGASTAGSKIIGNFESPYEATVVAKLREAGAIVFGKTNLDEFGMGSSNEYSSYGPVKNPWDKSRVPGGSSGGSSASVAARLVPAALGTDTGGSIRQPASLCGIVGLKPTYGRVSRYGMVAFASSLDQIGPMARTVHDCGLVTEAISGHDPHDSTSVEKEVPSLTGSLGEDIKGLRIGIPKEYFIDGVDPQVDSAVRSAVSKYEELGAEIVDVSLPHTEAAVATYYILAPAEASSNLSRYDGIRYGLRASDTEDLFDLYCKTRSEGFGPEVKRRIMIGTYVLSSGYYDAFYLRAQKVRTLIQQDFFKAFESSCDVIACPVAPTTAFKIGDQTKDALAMYLNDIFTIPTSLAGLPGMSLPCGFDDQGLPIGLQLIGQAWKEDELLKAAAAYEATQNWSEKTPGGE